MIIFIIFLGTSLLLHSMDSVPLLKKDFVEIGIRVPSKNKQENWFHPLKEHIKKQNKVLQRSDDCSCIAKGAGFGGCGGFLSGANGMCAYDVLDGCMWLWCNVVTPKDVMCNIMMWGLPTCTSVGCLAGICCVMTGYSKKIDFIFK